MPEYKVETLYQDPKHNIPEFNKEVEDKIHEYIQDDYILFSHQITNISNNLTVQLVFIKEDVYITRPF